MYNAVRQAYLAQKSLFRSPRLGTYLPKIRTIAQEDFRKCVGVRLRPRCAAALFLHGKASGSRGGDAKQLAFAVRKACRDGRAFGDRTFQFRWRNVRRIRQMNTTIMKRG